MNEFYVYIHNDPRTGETVYVGKGKYGRAWDVTRCRNKNHKHQQWMLELSSLGYLPQDWVSIHERHLTEEEAYRAEKEYLYKFGVLRFNGQSGERNYQAKLTDKQAIEIYKRSKTEHHKDLAKEFGVSRAAISMISARKQWKATLAGVQK